MMSALAALPAIADDDDTLRSECAKQLQLSASERQCVVDKARSDLNDEERRLDVAHVTRDQNAAASLQQDMPGESVMKAVNFMASAPQSCSGQ